MLPAHFVFAAYQEHTVIALLTAHLSQEDVSKEEEVKLSQAACEEENNNKPGLVGIVNKLTSVAMAH